MKVWIKVLLILVLIAIENVNAVEVKDLYEVEVIAKSEHEHDKVAAIKQAMRLVLTRILAGTHVLQDPLVNSVLENAVDYVSEYQLSLAETSIKNTRLMRVLFNEQRLINTLRSGEKWLWNEIRPRTLLWLVVEEEGIQRFFDPDEMPYIDRVLKKASEQKKIPILLPIQDLNEKRIVSIADVLSAYSEHLLEVSVRYEVVSTLAGKFVKKGSCWKAEWTLYFDAKIEQWWSECSTLDSVALVGFQGVYQRLSNFYAAKQGNKKVKELKIKVSGIKLMAEVMRITDYLEALPMIKTATWLKAENGYNTYRVFYQGERKSLNNQLEAGHVLRAESFLNQRATEGNYRFLSK